MRNILHSLLCLMTGCCWTAAAEQSRPDVRTSAVAIVRQIQRADYDGDRPALRRLHGELARLTVSDDDAYLRSRVRYWRGFALWRLMINGFNDAVDQRELEPIAEQAIVEFDEARKIDTAFIDPIAGAISCGQSLAFINRDNPEKLAAIVSRFRAPFKEALSRAPDNPRLLWVWGAQQWYQRDRAGAMTTYRTGLDLVRDQQRHPRDPLEPAWGEPELLMSLAWAYLNSEPPDAAAADIHAQMALKLVPHWRYVRDILWPQIKKARSRGGPHLQVRPRTPI